MSVTPAGGERLAQSRLLRLVGLGVRGRRAVIGVQQVRQAAQRGKLHLAIAANDASRNSMDKALPLLRARKVRVVMGPSSAELGSAVGRERTAMVGIVDAGLAKGIRALELSAPPDDREEGAG